MKNNDEKRDSIIEVTGLRWFTLIVVIILNIAMLSGAFMLYAKYVSAYKDRLFEENREKIENLNQSAAANATALINSWNIKLNDVARYTELHQLTHGEALAMISDDNSDPDRCFELIASNYTGHLAARQADGTYPALSYDDPSYADLKKVIDNVGDDKSTDICFTPEFTDGISRNKCFAIYKHITLYNNGKPIVYTLLLAYDSSYISEYINSQNDYKDQSTILMDDKGNYIIGNKDFKTTKLNIRRYTDYVTTEFSVMDHDIGRSLAFISYHFPSVDITEICTNVLKTLVPDEREVATNNHKVFFMRVAPYRSTENKILGCVITLMDITSQKQGQAILQNTEKQLTIAQQASEAKSDYLSRIAHEIRTPMSSIVGLLKNARAQAEGNPALLQNISQISETVSYMTSIVTDISEASIGENLNGEQANEPFALRAVIDNVSAIIEPRAEEAQLAYEVSIDDSFNPKYTGSKTKIQQILINFLNNSVMYTKPGGAVTVRVFEEPRQGEKVRLCFIVADTGVGIKKENISKLFKPYTREDPEDENAPMTVGLGLSIAYNLIMSMHGDVSVESEEGRGSTFTIHVQLDRYSEEKKADKPEPVPVVPHDYGLCGKNILIAEDNALNRTILGALLANEGMTFTEAVDGEQVVKLYMEAPDNAFACILMDMRMPKLDGIRATQIIRASGKPDAESIPIIGVSANGYTDDIKQARKAGINEYTTKPIERENLLLAMEKLIGDKK